MGRRILLAALLAAAACGDDKGAARGPQGTSKPAPPERVEPPKPALPPVEPPTGAECESALANLTRVIPEGVVGDAVDMKFCMAMPRAVVKCLIDVKTEDEADRCMVGFVGSVPAMGGGAPSPAGATEAPPRDEPRAGKDDCRRAIENVRRLVPGMTGDTEEMVEQCAGTEPLASVRCLAVAKSPEELDSCDLRGE